MELEDLRDVKFGDLLKYLQKIGKQISELTLPDLLKIIEEQGFLKKSYPEPKKVPLSLAGRKIYYNLYTVEYTADKYEGSITQTYACYSLDKPLTDTSILRKHHLHFYPNHDIISLEYDGSYEREHLGRAKVVYDPSTDTWIDLEVQK